MTKQIRLNAFAMNCVAHQSPGLWTHPRDRTLGYNRLPYWLDLAKTLERGRFDGLFLAAQPDLSDRVPLAGTLPARGVASVPVQFPVSGGEIGAIEPLAGLRIDWPMTVMPPSESGPSDGARIWTLWPRSRSARVRPSTCPWTPPGTLRL